MPEPYQGRPIPGSSVSPDQQMDTPEFFKAYLDDAKGSHINALELERANFSAAAAAFARWVDHQIVKDHLPIPMVRSPLVYQVTEAPTISHVCTNVTDTTITFERVQYHVKAPELSFVTTVAQKDIERVKRDLCAAMHREVDRIFGLPLQCDDFYSHYIHEPDPPQRSVDYRVGQMTIRPDPFYFIKSSHAE